MVDNRGYRGRVDYDHRVRRDLAAFVQGSIGKEWQDSVDYAAMGGFRWTF
jgi:hypothetical protein